MTTLKLFLALRPKPIAQAAALLCGRNIDTLTVYREVPKVISNIPGKRYHFRIASGRCPPEIEIPDRPTARQVMVKPLKAQFAANDPIVRAVSQMLPLHMEAAAREAMRRTMVGKPK